MKNKNEKCIICDSVHELRLGVCFNCAEAQTILIDGVDMQDKGLDGTSKATKLITERLKFLIKKGWKNNS